MKHLKPFNSISVSGILILLNIQFCGIFHRAKLTILLQYYCNLYVFLFFFKTSAPLQAHWGVPQRAFRSRTCIVQPLKRQHHAPDPPALTGIGLLVCISPLTQEAHWTSILKSVQKYPKFQNLTNYFAGIFQILIFYFSQSIQTLTFCSLWIPENWN